jgi:dsDNA-specific endonuclease/ATPase MutS2
VVGEILSISDTDATILFDSVRLRTSPDKLRKVSRAEARKAQRNWQKGIAADLSEKAEHFDLTLDVRGHRAEEALDPGPRSPRSKLLVGRFGGKKVHWTFF